MAKRRSSRGWPRLGILRLLVAFMLLMSLSGLSQAAEEAVESAIHVADTGHAAHSAHHPEGDADHGEDGTEHFCSGPFHHCGCCPNASATAPTTVRMPDRTIDRLRGGIADDDLVLEGVRVRIDRPPRA